ncbi:MAG: DUF433 domain-containing protein [Pyrinomonadaceae bacterium]
MIIDLEQCGGRPCIRGMRMRVIDVIDRFAAGWRAEGILKEMPEKTKSLTIFDNDDLLHAFTSNFNESRRNVLVRSNSRSTSATTAAAPAS